MFIQTAWPFAVGERINATLSFPRLLQPVHVRGVVTRRRAGSPSPRSDIPGLPAGVGVRFSGDAVKSYPVLGRLLHEATDSSSGDATAPRTGGTLADFKVLVVENDPAVAALYEHAIQRGRRPRQGLEVTVAEDGIDALRKLEETPYNLLVTDLFMPSMSGYELIDRVRNHPRMSRVKIAIVSVGKPEDLAHAMRIGADAVVAKPVRPRDIVETIRVLLRFQEYSFAELT
jgi:CheY-like chemotaxis protein